MLNDRPISLKREEQAHRKDFKKKMRVATLSIAALVVLGGMIWAYMYSSTEEKTSNNQVISRSGIHWHSNLSINTKGETVPFPSNVGLGAVHNPIHTHDSDGAIHMEFEGRVTEKDTELKKFFEVWGKDFSKDSLLGNVTGAEGKVIMFVNGKENLEFENYYMKDGDKIELKFE